MMAFHSTELNFVTSLVHDSHEQLLSLRLGVFIAVNEIVQKVYEDV